MKERTLFLAAVEILDPADRQHYLNHACGDDIELRKRLEVLLSSYDVAGDFLQRPVLGGIPIENDYPKPTPAASGASPSSFDDTTVALNGVEAKSIGNKLGFLSPTSVPGALGRLGHYTVLELVGEGAFGLVLKAHDEKLERTVAIKVMKPHLAETSAPRKRFLREARAGAAIRHQNVVSVYSVEEEPIPYLVMEYIEGVTLQDIINEAGPLELDHVLSIARQLASALAAAHANGLIHRDIKPSNILLEQRIEQRVIITDFGLARTVDDASLTQSGTVAGTPMYMSPEQAYGQTLDARSDLFSLGSVLYVMLTGRPPFRAPTTVAVLKRVVEASPRPIKELIPEAPDWLCAIVGKLHASDPINRFQTAKEIVDLLARCQAELIQFGEARLENIHTHVDRNVQSNGNSATNRKAQALTQTARPPHHLQWITSVALASLLFVIASLWMVPKLLNLLRTTEQVRVESATHPLSSTQAPTTRWDFLPKGAPSPVLSPVAAESAKAFQRAWADYLELPVEFTNRLGIRFRLIPPGEFDMGNSSAAVEEIRSDRELVGIVSDDLLQSTTPKHRVMITEPFYLASTEITQSQYEMVSSDNPSGHSHSGSHADRVVGIEETGNFPLELVSWTNAIHFCRAMSDREGLTWPYDLTGEKVIRNQTSDGYFLPSEAQWEYACRAGTESMYWTGDSTEGLSKAAYFANRNGRTHAVAELDANPFGLYDIHGNVYEWVFDSWEPDYYLKQSKSRVSIDPAGPESISSLRVVKGGDFYWPAVECRSASKFAFDQSTDPRYAIGFRIAIPCATVRKLIARPFREPAILDFVEVHSLPLKELETWIESSAKEYVPLSVNVRQAQAGVLLDVVAVSRLQNPSYEFHILTTDFELDFQKMRDTHRCALRIEIPAKDTNPVTTLALWQVNDITWNTYSTMPDQLDTRFETQRGVGNIPIHFNIGREKSGALNAQFCSVYSPGIGHHSFWQLSLAEFSEKVVKYRKRGWRPHFLNLHTGIETPTVGAMFRENADGVQWDYSPDLSLDEYERQIIGRKRNGFYPFRVVSFEEQERTRFVVLWEEMRR